MVKQDQNQSQQSNQDHPQFSTPSQGSYQKKAHENQQQEEKEIFIQDPNYKQFKDEKVSKHRSVFHGFDRNEGEGHSQKF